MNFLAYLFFLCASLILLIHANVTGLLSFSIRNLAVAVVCCVTGSLVFFILSCLPLMRVPHPSLVTEQLCTRMHVVGDLEPYDTTLSVRTDPPATTILCISADSVYADCGCFCELDDISRANVGLDVADGRVNHHTVVFHHYNYGETLHALCLLTVNPFYVIHSLYN